MIITTATSTTQSSHTRLIQCLSYYYRYINPWIRFLLILVALYLYSISSSVLTYRNNSFEEEMKSFGTAPGTYPLEEARDRRWFILKDLMFEVISPASGSVLQSLSCFADVSPLLFNCLLFMLLIARRDIIRFTEYSSIQIYMFLGNALVHIVTTLPDSHGLSETCIDRKYYSMGDWIYYTLTTSYCGDMLWSGHTANTLVPMIMIRRMIYDSIGWNISYKTSRYLQQNTSNRNSQLETIASTNEVETREKFVSSNEEERKANVGAVAWQHDIFFRTFNNSQENDQFVLRHIRLIWSGVTFIRMIFVFMFTALIYALIKIRYHYTVDIIVAIIVALLVSTNTQLIQALLRILYRPNYKNYKNNNPWSLVYLAGDLDEEQKEYEQRVRMAGIGGWI
jgi:hypothetical protein